MNLIPTQVPVPGLPELILLTVVLAIACVIIGRWVYLDAKSLGSDWAWQWGVGIFVLLLFGVVLGVIGLAIYLLVRERRLEPEPNAVAS